MKLLLFPIIGFISAILMGPEAQPAKWLVTEESSLQISGSSNVNNFQCTSLSYTGKDTLYEIQSTVYGPASLSGVINLEAEGIDCQNILITNGFMETVKAEEYPQIRISLLSLKKGNRYTEAQYIKGMVEISMAGVSRKYPLSSKLEKLDEGKAYLQGQQSLRLSDFGLQPKPKMLGMIKVEDSVSVDFQLIIQAVSIQH